MKKQYNIEIDCAVCANKVQEAIKKIDGVTFCTVNYILQKMTIEIDDGKDFSAVLKQAVKLAKSIESDFEIEL
ncbi:MAG: cation transporter [Clostridia bacterium]|nr:cation transporter [Clostridia bacterium]